MIEFILERHAQTEAELKELAAQQKKTEAGLGALKDAIAETAAQQKKTDASLNRAIRWGVQEARRHRREMQELKQAQLRTDATLQTFIDSLRRGGNGHP